jgi:uncharacterized membrane protein YgcG
MLSKQARATRHGQDLSHEDLAALAKLEERRVVWDAANVKRRATAEARNLTRREMTRDCLKVNAPTRKEIEAAVRAERRVEAARAATCVATAAASTASAAGTHEARARATAAAFKATLPPNSDDRTSASNNHGRRVRAQVIAAAAAATSAIAAAAAAEVQAAKAAAVAANDDADACVGLAERLLSRRNELFSKQLLALQHMRDRGDTVSGFNTQRLERLVKWRKAQSRLAAAQRTATLHRRNREKMLGSEAVKYHANNPNNINKDMWCDGCRAAKRAKHHCGTDLAPRWCEARPPEAVVLGNSEVHNGCAAGGSDEEDSADEEDEGGDGDNDGDGDDSGGGGGAGRSLVSGRQVSTAQPIRSGDDDDGGGEGVNEGGTRRRAGKAARDLTRPRLHLMPASSAPGEPVLDWLPKKRACAGCKAAGIRAGLCGTVHANSLMCIARTSYVTLLPGLQRRRDEAVAAAAGAAAANDGGAGGGESGGGGGRDSGGHRRGAGIVTAAAAAAAVATAASATALAAELAGLTKQQRARRHEELQCATCSAAERPPRR